MFYYFKVKFGRKSTKRQSVPEEITFFLLHLSLMREYLELEFAPVKDKLIGFDYDFEKIIDDWVSRYKIIVINIPTFKSNL